MKKISTFIILMFALGTYAQDAATAKKDTSYWKKSGFLGLNASMTQLSNWQGGGQNNIAINGIFNYQAEYKKGKHQWLNKLDAQYGIIRPGNANLFRKNIDQLFALSKYNIDAFSKYWFYMAQADYRTQFAPGLNYDGDNVVGRAVSDLNSPGYIQLAIGLDYKPTNYFSATFAPLAGKITTVNRQYLADAGAFGVEKATYDANGVLLTPGKRLRAEFGGRLMLKFKKDIAKNLNLDSYLDLFSNYMHNPGNIDVVFNNLVSYKLSKYITATLVVQTLYDDDITVYRYSSLFKPEDNINGPRLQVISTFAVGFGYKF
ncbi:MAG: DUF3078 domain-containing protein [Bacteroidia bacterium]|nr:DUF3078 domain-containing protein [Bacteroidia bacterium]